MAFTQIVSFETVSDEAVSYGTQDINNGGIADNGSVSICGSQAVNSGGMADYTIVNYLGEQDVYSGGVANNTIINDGYQEVLSGGIVNDTRVNPGGNMYVSSGGIVSGALTIAGGHVTIANSDNMHTKAMGFLLADAKVNDALLTIQSGVVGDISQVTFTLDVNNTATGTYILGTGADMTSMNNAVFTVKDSGQSVDVKVGSSYTFADGDKLSLSLTDAATDQLTAAFTAKGGVLDTVPPTVPTGLKQTVTGNSVALDWADSADKSHIKQYDLRVDNNSDFSSPEHTETVIPSQAAGNNIPVGTYYWDVRAQDNAGNWSDWSKSSSFTITPTDTGANTWKMAKNIDEGVDNWVGFGDPADVYRVVMANSGRLTLELTHLSGNADLSLLSAAGAVLKISANPGTANDVINAALLKGTYYVKIAPAAGMTDVTYTFGKDFDYVPSDTGANTWQAAKDIGAGVDNWVGFGDPADYYRLTTANAGTLTLRLLNLTDDANLSLLSATGAVLKTSANPGTTDEAISAALLAGTYYVKVAPGTSTSFAAYTLTNSEIYCPTDIAANTWQTAKDISALDNWVGFGDAADVYRLVMDRAGTLTLGMTGLNANADLSLLSAAGAVLKTSANPGMTDEAINNVALLKGTYYVKVAAVTGVTDARYILSSQVTYFPGDTNDQAGNTTAAAKIVDALLPPQNGWVGLGDSDDYYRFNLAAATPGTLRLSMDGGNADLSLYDANGRLLQKSAKTGTFEDMITRNLAVGTYYARVNAVSGNSIDYTLTFDKKPLAGMLVS